jgi:NAD(P)-dependent dehydrogenase (short-subunit alcohol dehydrogenase family)
VAPLDRRVAVVTGGSAGLGRAIAEALGRSGASIAIFGRSAGAGEAAARELGEAGMEARFYPTDVSRSADVDRSVAAALSDFGRIDVLVNNAGLSKVGHLTHELPDEIWNESIGTMQSGVFYCSRAVVPGMIDAGSGSIVNISSIRAFSPRPRRLAYCAAKAAVEAMSRVMAAELGPFGIRVNTVAPGQMRTAMWDDDVARGLLDEQHYLDVIPVRRIGVADDVGAVCAFLASDDAAYITGACIAVDGGLTSVPAG